MLKNEYVREYNNVTIPKGMVLYHHTPVQTTTDKSKWEYQIKTTGELFNGNFDEMSKMISEVSSMIDYHKPIIHNSNVGYSPFDDE